MMTSTEIRNRQNERIDTGFHPGTRADALVILGHGLTGNKDRPQLVALATGLAARGWPCLRISYPGNGGSEGRFEDCCVTKEIGDLQSVLEMVPNDVKVAYAGHSMGGAVGVLTAARDMRIFTLISLAGMTHTAAFVQREFSDVVPGAGLMWDEEEHPLTEKFVDDLKSIESTLHAAEAVIQPWLFIHGDADDLVPIQDSRDAYQAATCEKSFLEIPGGDHAFEEKDYPKIIDAVDFWLATHIGPRPA
ncbi:MAG: alpha/beta fold hydrolase [Luteolibacter sp.]